MNWHDQRRVMPSRSSSPARGIPGWVFAGALALVVAVLELAGPWRGPGPTAADRVFLTEFAATVASDVADDDGDLSDWIEITNFGREVVSLDGWHLTDNFRKLAKWRFPAVELMPGARMVVFASGKDRRDPGQRLHTNFELDERGEYLALVRADGRTVAQEFLPKFPRQSGHHTFGLRDSLRAVFAASGVPFDAYRYFDRGTPGTLNGLELAGVAGAVKASEDSGLLDRPVAVALFTSTAGAAIHYTTDGSVPSRHHGLRYRGPLQIRTTTIVKAVAVRPGFASSDVTTRTYLFPSAVPDQTGVGFPASWGTTNGEPVRAYYAMSGHAMAGAEERARVVEGLRSLPTLALSTTLSNLFDPANGLYANPMERGGSWERPVTAEWFPIDGARGFQVGAGLRIQGGWNRRPEECPKHSLRLVFKKEFGEARLKHPLFGAGGEQAFETLTLRGGCNNSWLHWDGAERRRGDYLRDQWMRETQAAMGHLAARGLFVHLYINGLYWGVYNLVERPSAPFVAANEGGVAGDFDSIAAGAAVSGDLQAWLEVFALVNSGVTDDAAYEAVAARVDLTGFADYMLLNYYGANGDWDRSSNWYAARRRHAQGRFVFFVWDGERTLEHPEDNRMDFDDDLSPSRLFHRLEAHPSFRRLFAERARMHCGEGGALSPAVAAARYSRLARLIDPGIYAEAARWGAYRFDVHPYKAGPYERYTVDRSWRPEVQRLLTRYFPKRTALFLEQLRQRGLLATPP
jgi:hypothetical protein